ncbi:hypothetical protein, unlikely [Trypanosoma brucei gambiense DAL972]|uniref:DUF7578 domain-containing protein n=1 Tax=Trypanosoma brucei gambiense (strain MHOM/CI/86/DAL972) TaxID=679716 RepID=C9ZL12_TRYB9|nr:hypothetical protein, unlikely [Trypanosoma brucei gambiense DAL972]CBH10021.1 hypothetical protein, unlikely [Trypanosoma brucei gambiense DAL972]|eukprot:XP_011772311.1 hypothetical protein, unlikely [Trypanosoma brucei gambiense DAL972]
MPRTSRAATPEGNNASPQVARNIGGLMRRPRDEDVAPPPAQPPQIRQRNEEGPNWTMDSEVRDVLLEDVPLQRYEVLRNMKLRDFLMQKFSNTYDTQNVAMGTFVKNPRRYIDNAEIL